MAVFVTEYIIDAARSFPVVSYCEFCCFYVLNVQVLLMHIYEVVL